MYDWKYSGAGPEGPEIEVEPGVFFNTYEMASLCRLRNAEIARLVDERDRYKPYHDAVVDMAIVNWTLDGMTEKDANDAIRKLIHCYCMERSDPAVSEEMAKVTARASCAAGPWRFDVENAPKDTAEIVGSFEGHYGPKMLVAYWDFASERWRTANGDYDADLLLAWTDINPPEVKP